MKLLNCSFGGRESPAVQINLHIYTDTSDPQWIDIRCNACGHKISQVQGNIINIVLGSSMPARVFRADSGFQKIQCRSCKAVTNIILTPYAAVKVSEVAIFGI